MRYYTHSHEWLAITDTITLGITAFAVEELGEIVHIELPVVGQTIQKGDEIGTIESVKTVSSLYAPVSGVITAINPDCIQNPEIMSTDPYAAWLVSLTPSDVTQYDSLLDEAAYKTHCDSQ